MARKKQNLNVQKKGYHRYEGLEPKIPSEEQVASWAVKFFLIILFLFIALFIVLWLLWLW